jgi:hypothetical protein
MPHPDAKRAALCGAAVLFGTFYVMIKCGDAAPPDGCHGVELPAVMQAGGWRTAEMVSRYTARLDARRSGAAKLAVLQNRE